MIERHDFDDVATVGELQAILDKITAQYGDDVELTVPRSDGYRVPTHPTLITDPDRADDWPTLELTHDHPATPERVFVALKTVNDYIAGLSSDRRSHTGPKGSIGPGTVIGVFAEQSAVETAAEAYGEYRHASDIDVGEPYPDVIIYDVAWNP